MKETAVYCSGKDFSVSLLNDSNENNTSL